MTEISARVIADSISPTGDRITTMLLRYPRFFHAEFMTHKDMSRNAASSRAIPFMKMFQTIWKHMAAPIYWGKHQPGMQAQQELQGFAKWWAKFMWYTTGYLVLCCAWLMWLAKPHKQTINRMMEPWTHITVQVTATNWDRMLGLRLDNAAQPEFQELARQIKRALAESMPTRLRKGEWHLPWIRTLEKTQFTLDEQKIISVARSARLSYAVDGEPSMTTVQKDMERYLKLLDSQHWSCFEHQATPQKGQHANMKGWLLLRTILEAIDTPQVKHIV